MEIGFWSQNVDDVDDKRPFPTSCSGREWRKEYGRIWTPEIEEWTMSYLSGHHHSYVYIESWEMAYAPCRFKECLSPAKELGAVTLCDGTFIWPEGYIHYVTQHDILPSRQLIQHVLHAYDKKPRRIPSLTLMMWDVERQVPSSLPLEILKWITQHTTLKEVYHDDEESKG